MRIQTLVPLMSVLAAGLIGSPATAGERPEIQKIHEAELGHRRFLREAGHRNGHPGCPERAGTGGRAVVRESGNRILEVRVVMPGA